MNKQSKMTKKQCCNNHYTTPSYSFDLGCLYCEIEQKDQQIKDLIYNNKKLKEYFDQEIKELRDNIKEVIEQ